MQNGTRVNLSWTDNATNETGFVIERSADNGVTFSEIGTAPAKSGTGSVTYTDTTIAAGNTYTYRVKAVNGSTSSGYSNTASVTVPAAGVPAAPTGLTVTSRQAGTTDTVMANWVSFQERSLSYVIEYATDSAFTQNVISQSVSTNTFSKTGFPRNKTYYFRVQAVNQIGSSPWSSGVKTYNAIKGEFINR